MARRKTHEEFVDDVYNLVGNKFEVVGEYTLSKSNIRMYHRGCGSELDIIANNFLKRGSCPKCSKFKTQKEFTDMIDKKYKGEYKLIGEYQGSTKPVILKCVKHDIHFERNVKSLFRYGNSCPVCKREEASERQKKPELQFVNEVESRHEGTIIPIDKYDGTHVRINFKCLICNTTFKTSPNAVIRISGCPTCAEPKGERDIRKYLINNGIEFEAQKTFPGCEYKRPLYFDFYLPKHNILIEYDGMQHYKPIKFFGGKEGFRYQQIRDKIKNEYTEDKNIKLIRIPYTVVGDKLTEKLDRELINIISK